MLIALIAARTFWFGSTSLIWLQLVLGICFAVPVLLWVISSMTIEGPSAATHGDEGAKPRRSQLWATCGGMAVILLVLGAGWQVMSLVRGEPFIMRFTRTADFEAIEISHPKHAQPIRLLFTPQGPPIDQTIVANRSALEFPFGTLDFIDITIMPGRIRMTHQGVALDILSVRLSEPRGDHEWGKALDLDFRKPANNTGIGAAPGGKTNPTVPAPSP